MLKYGIINQFMNRGATMSDSFQFVNLIVSILLSGVALTIIWIHAKIIFLQTNHQKKPTFTNYFLFVFSVSYILLTITNFVMYL